MHRGGGLTVLVQVPILDEKGVLNQPALSLHPYFVEASPMEEKPALC